MRNSGTISNLASTLHSRRLYLNPVAKLAINRWVRCRRSRRWRRSRRSGGMVRQQLAVRRAGNKIDLAHVANVAKRRFACVRVLADRAGRARGTARTCLVFPCWAREADRVAMAGVLARRTRSGTVCTVRTCSAHLTQTSLCVHGCAPARAGAWATRGEMQSPGLQTPEQIGSRPLRSNRPGAHP